MLIHLDILIHFYIILLIKTMFLDNKNLNINQFGFLIN